MNSIQDEIINGNNGNEFQPNKALEKEIINDEIPNRKQSIIGFIFGFIGVDLVVYVPLYLLIFIFGRPSTEFGLLTISSASQTIAEIIIIISMLILIKNRLRAIGHNFKAKLILKAMLYAVILYGLNIVCNIIDSALFGSVADTNANQLGVEALIKNNPLLGFVFVGIVGPILEELTYRYFLFRPLYNRNKVLAFIVSGCLFGLIHMGSSLITFISDHDTALLLNDLRSLPSYIAAGLLFCFIYQRTKTIWGSVLTHMIYNSALFVLILLVSTSQVSIKSVKTSQNNIVVTVEKLGQDTSINEVYLTYVNENNETIRIDLDHINENEFYFTDLNSDIAYTIVIEYTYYEAIIGTSDKVEREGKISSYAYARDGY